MGVEVLGRNWLTRLKVPESAEVGQRIKEVIDSPRNEFSWNWSYIQLLGPEAMHFGHDECSPTGLVIVINARWIKSRPETEHYQDWINSILHRLYCLWIIKQYPPCTPALSTMLCKLLLQTTSKSTILVNLEWLWATNTPIQSGQHDGRRMIMSWLQFRFLAWSIPHQSLK